MTRPPAEPERGRPAVFLDRDGVLVEDVDYLARVADLRVLPGVPAALARLRAAGFALVVVTNQSGVARGILDEPRLAELHAELERRLAADGARLDAIYWCPHHPSEGAPPWRRDCACRKPRPGMLLRAAADLGLDLAQSFAVGDSGRDLEAGRAAGLRGGVLVRTGKGRAEAARLAAAGALDWPVVDDLGAAAALLADPARRAHFS